MKRVFVVLLGVLLSVSVAHGFYGDIATDRESFTLGVAGQNANQITSLTALFPIENANGWAGAYVSRQVADSEVVSETLNGHLQGGFAVRGIGIEAYIEATRDKWRMIDLAIETGYFIRPGTFTWNAITFSGGVGNYTERTGLRTRRSVGTKQMLRPHLAGWRLSVPSGGMCRVSCGSSRP